MSSRRLYLALASLGITAVVASGCATSVAGPMEKSNEVMCLDGLALPVTSGAQIFLDPEVIPDLRAQAFAVLDSTAPDQAVTDSSHDVARKLIIVIDTVEGMDPGPGLGLLGSGLDSLSTLAQPLDDLLEAHSELAQACGDLGVTPSPSLSSV